MSYVQYILEFIPFENRFKSSTLYNTYIICCDIIYNWGCY